MKKFTGTFFLNFSRLFSRFFFSSNVEEKNLEKKETSFCRRETTFEQRSP